MYLHGRTLVAYLSFEGTNRLHYKRAGSDDRLEWFLSMIGPENAVKVERLELIFPTRKWWYVTNDMAERLSWTWDRILEDKVWSGRIRKEDILFAFRLDGLGLRKEAVQVLYKTGRPKGSKSRGLRQFCQY